MAAAYPQASGAPASSATVAAPATTSARKPASQANTKTSHVDAKATPASKVKPTPAPTTPETYHLSHRPHQLDSYQNALTPPPAANER